MIEDGKRTKKTLIERKRERKNQAWRASPYFTLIAFSFLQTEYICTERFHSRITNLLLVNFVIFCIRNEYSCREGMFIEFKPLVKSQSYVFMHHCIWLYMRDMIRVNLWIISFGWGLHNIRSQYMQRKIPTCPARGHYSKSRKYWWERAVNCCSRR